MLSNITFIVLGFIFLIKGADYLVSGASSIAKKLGIAPIVIGLTVVAFGTSAPELLVNLFSAVNGNTELAVSNIIGSNIANILLILGVAATIIPIDVQRNTTYKEIPFALLAVVVVGLIANDIFIDGGLFNIISRIDGFVLLLFFIVFMYYTYGISKGNTSEMESIKKYKTYISWIMVIGGLFGLFFGGKLVVDGAVGIAHVLGLSERIIGVTIIAIGTSLPELVTAIVAAIKKQPDIVIGGIVGSNIFNSFWILGVSSIISPLPFSVSLNIDLIFNILVTILLFISIFIGTRHKLTKFEGIIFLLVYVVFIGSVFLT